jgi:hypothetical protein
MARGAETRSALLARHTMRLILAERGDGVVVTVDEQHQPATTVE